MRSACGQARRRPRQWLRSSSPGPSSQLAPSSGFTGLSLAEVRSHDARPPPLSGFALALTCISYCTVIS